ncbi:serine hydrolase domain-containing protein [Bacillus sp. 31A1R]|uniref:Serine hydrolase domain-containing protein n=1 Tax=Robertmurraya mangrovi TaxID=3098077 RepID=A0ABU5IWB7_9BACI|nr:serine hydrolase domain-containing protein [Bacillus sp. 31A1R]MDZ5471431.1 serine hydrolase domain-containing protein [Bacillus sp. 31A1R]
MNLIKETLHNYMNQLDKHQYFNGSVLVGYKGEVLFSKGYGQASYQYQIPSTSTTKYRVGSLTKAFTAMAILILHEQGKLSIEDTIDAFLPEYKHGHKISIENLVMQTSGIPNFTSAPDYWTHKMRLPNTLENIISEIVEMELDFEPGVEMDYSNSNYHLLTFIVEKASGQTYAKFIEDHIINVIGLKNTGVDNGRTIVPNLATGHTIQEEIIHTEFIDMSFPLGTYGIYSTVEDLYVWSQALLSNKLVDAQLQAKMFHANGMPYSYGWFVEEEGEIVSHFGDINGFVNHFTIFVEEELTVIVLSNLNITPVTHISETLANIVLGKPYVEMEDFNRIEKPLSLELLTGDYAPVKVDYSNGRLFATIPKMYGVPYRFGLTPVNATNTTIVCKSEFINDTYTFEIDESGEPLLVKVKNCAGVETNYTFLERNRR